MPSIYLFIPGSKPKLKSQRSQQLSFPKNLKKMSLIPPHFNYAHIIGIKSIPGAVIFTVLYVPLLVWFIRQSFTHPTYIHYVLTFFCTIRVIAFTIRTVLASSKSAGESLGLVIADEILFGVGYFSLLYSAYTLVLDRMLLSNLPPPRFSFLKFFRHRSLFRSALLTALILGIVASSSIGSNRANSSTAKALHIASTVVFLALTIIQVLETNALARSNISGRSHYYVRGKDSPGIKYGDYILPIISLLLLTRESFVTATVRDSARQDNEHLWYPFLALPEILVVILFIVPGLVPRRDELPSSSTGTSAA